MSISDMINITLSIPRTNYSTNSSGITVNQVVPENDFFRSSYASGNEAHSQFDNVESDTFYRNFYDCMKTPDLRKNISYQIQPNGELQKLTPACGLPEELVKKTSPWRLIIQEEDVITSSPVYKKPKSAYDKNKDRSGFCNFLKKAGWKTGIIPGQEYLDDLYEIARSRNDPLLLESLESFLAATVEGLLQKQSDNEKLDTALKRATEKNSAIALELEAEMEHQVAMLEEKIRQEEQRKLEEQKHEAQTQLFSAQQELKDMENKVKELEEHIEEKKNEANIPDVIIEEIQNKEKENKLLQKKLVEFQTQMALMRTEVAQMKAVYDEQAERLATERGAVLSCVTEQENLTRQLHLLHEANKRLHDTNDDLRSALDHKRSTENSYADDAYPFMRSASAILPRGRNSSLYNSFRSDPGARRQNGNTSNYDTDDDSKLSIPYDDDEMPTKIPDSVNETPLLAEIMAVDKSYPYESPIPMMGGSAGHSRTYSPANSTLMEPTATNLDRENFIKQLEILCETNKRLGESNDELRDALGLLSGQIRMDQEIIRRTSTGSAGGCRSAPITPMRNKCPDIERPQSTSSPRRILLTKSGYHSSLSMYAKRQPDEFVDEDDMDDEELVRLVDQTNEDDLSGSMTEDQIYIEEKILEPNEPRGPAVGADTSEDSMSISDRGTPDRMYKLVLAGDAAVGKSSFIIRLCRNKFYSALNSTLGVDFQMKTLNVDGSKVALQLWDTAGQERFRSIAKSYFRRVDGVILLYDVTCENSFMDVREWLESIESSSSKDVPVIICGNKTDLRNEAAKNGMPVVTRQQGLKLAQEVNALFIETSAKDGTNIHKACVELTRKLQKLDDAQMTEVTVNLEEKPKPKSRCCR